MPYTVARPSPVPLPFSLVVKKGSKMWLFVWASMPVPVSDGEQHVRAGLGREVLRGVGFVELGVRGLDRELAALRHGVARVHGQVHDHLLELTGIRLHRAHVGCERRAQLDVLADETAQ